MRYFVYAGSKDEILSLQHRPMYGSEDFEVAWSYARNRYIENTTYVHRLVFKINKPATPDDVDRAVDESGLTYESENWLSQGDSLKSSKVRDILKARGFDGAVAVWDFDFEGEEVPVIVVFDAAKQVIVPDQTPYFVSERRA